MATLCRHGCILLRLDDTMIVDAILPDTAVTVHCQLSRIRCNLLRLPHLDNLMVQKETWTCVRHRQLGVICRRHCFAHHTVASDQADWFWLDHPSSRVPVLGLLHDLMSVDQGPYPTNTLTVRNLSLLLLFRRTSNGSHNA